MHELNFIQYVAVSLVPMLLAITLHEAAHAVAAFLLGDRTAYLLGRVSLDPFKHLDWIGTVFFPVVCLLSGMKIILGWAKPLPIDTRNFKNPKRDNFLVAIAGPLANFLMAFIWGGFLKLLSFFPEGLREFLRLTSFAGVTLNLTLGFFNLLPIPTFDGGAVLNLFVSPEYFTKIYYFFQRYGLIVIMLLVYSNILTYILAPCVYFGVRCINTFYGL